jgi:O-antigen biosynthesis protein
MSSRYDDGLWELVPDTPAPPPEHLRRFVAGLPAAERALDLGCGDGRLTSVLAVDHVVAADVSAVAVARARPRLADRAEVVELEPDATLPFDDSAFDVVLCAETLEHVRDVQLLLSEVRRVLSPGGTLAVTTPAHGRLTGVEILLRGFEHCFDPLSPHLRFFTRRSLARLLDGLGFRLESLERRRSTLLAIASR